MAFLPRGMKFNSAGDQGEYLTEQHATAWNLEELAPGAMATTELVVMPIEEGLQLVVRNPVRFFTSDKLPGKPESFNL